MAKGSVLRRRVTLRQRIDLFLVRLTRNEPLHRSYPAQSQNGLNGLNGLFKPSSLCPERRPSLHEPSELRQSV